MSSMPLAAAGAAALAMSGVAHAAFSYGFAQAQTTASLTTPDLAPIFESDVDFAPAPAPLGMYSASSSYIVDEMGVTANAQTMSEFTLSSLSIVGSGSIHHQLSVPESTMASVNARAFISFSSTNPIPYDLIAMFTSSSMSFGGALVEIKNSGGDTMLSVLAQEMVQDSGVLPPDSYTLTVRTLNSINFGSSTSFQRSMSYEFSFVVPAPGGAAAFAALALWGSRRRRS